MAGLSTTLPPHLSRRQVPQEGNQLSGGNCQLKRSGAVKGRHRPQPPSADKQAAATKANERTAISAEQFHRNQTDSREMALHARNAGAMRHVTMPSAKHDESSSKAKSDAPAAGTRPSKTDILDAKSLARTASMKAMRNTMDGYEFRAGADRRWNKFNPFIPTSNVKLNKTSDANLKNPVGRVSATIFQNGTADGIGANAEKWGQQLKGNERIRIEERHGAALTPGISASPIDMIAPGASILDYSDVMPMPKVKVGVDVGNWRESMMDIKAPVSPGGQPVVASEQADRKQAGLYASAGVGFSPMKSAQNSSPVKFGLSAGVKAKAGLEYHVTTSGQYAGNNIGKQFANYASGSGHRVPVGGDWTQSRKNGVRPTYEASASVPLGPSKKFVSTDKRKDEKVKPEGKKMSLAELDKKLGPRTGEAAMKMFENVFGKVPKDARKFSMLQKEDGRVEIYGHVKVKAADGLRLNTSILKAGNFAKGTADYSRLLFVDQLPPSKTM
ncbi:hypothetical protein TDB9533_00483 [Thalassocella blandensis]|nr:hypothetical protein TDB9533_00483 [Thalassocella blandensis]